ncbi:hypothetical protein LR48_Vigan10g166800 [Vigna angularis]|uniref:Uncharacterized protein n=2 Tax=Phaseolus angularis TaxID=3914 RepID=A0A0L9VL35_PHAAN|nr:hypothetical protein LR48_Vigan10g166800 [Vigna angularis]BAU01764.1 hypothetical protein VIGAN_11106600 [Vigna angularis var. angularis]
MLPKAAWPTRCVPLSGTQGLGRGLVAGALSDGVSLTVVARNIGWTKLTMLGRMGAFMTSGRGTLGLHRPLGFERRREDLLLLFSGDSTLNPDY